MRLLKGFTFCLFAVLFLASLASAKDITVIYTGDTHAMLYQCSCPVQRDGGVGRRATLLKQLRKSNPDSLLLDSGSFFAGGLMDEYTQNTEMDKQRTMVNLKALGIMKYDALGVSDDEFNFGKDFFLENIGAVKAPLLSCNLKSDKVAPYIIKEVSGVKIGIIGVSNRATANKAGGLEVTDPRAAVTQAQDEARKSGAQIIVLLSNLGEKDDANLISSVKGIDVVIIGKNPAKEEPFTKVADTYILRPGWQGRKVGKAVLSVEDNKIKDIKVEDIRLSDQIADDAEVLEVLPQCFQDTNCKKQGLLGKCSNPGTMSAKCTFETPGKVSLTVINAKDCAICDTAVQVDALKKQFPGLTVTNLIYPDKKTEKILKDIGAIGLPVFLFGKDIEKEKVFEGFKAKVDEKAGYYVLKPEFGGLAYFLNRPKAKDKLDIFISLFDKNSEALLQVIKEFNPVVHLLAVEQQGLFGAANGRLEIEEDSRAVCVQKLYPEAFWDYITCRAKNINSSYWEDCLGKYDAGKIKECARSFSGSQLLRENVSLNKELQIMTGPTYLIDNQQIFMTQEVPTKEEFKKILNKR